MKKFFLGICMLLFLSIGKIPIYAQRFEPIKFGDFNNWLTRNVTESKLLGGKDVVIYEICPSGTDNSGSPYSNRGGSPWATSNVLAKPSGITKVSNAVSPDEHPGYGKCAKLECKIEKCKAIGIINIEVLVGGSLFLGEMLEPVKDTKNPLSKMIMGVPFTGRPKALRFDYKFYLPDSNQRIYSSGFGKKKTFPGSDCGETCVLLQRRWEDSEGNIYAHRVGTARERYSKSTPDWMYSHDLKIIYGKNGESLKTLIPENNSYYARNSKGRMVPVREVGWDDENATPTHAIVMFSASGEGPYTGTPGLTLWVDNVGWLY